MATKRSTTLKAKTIRRAAKPAEPKYIVPESVLMELFGCGKKKGEKVPGMTADKLIALVGKHGVEGPTRAKMLRLETVAEGGRAILDTMLSAHGPSICARMLASLIWRIEDGIKRGVGVKGADLRAVIEGKPDDAA